MNPRVQSVWEASGPLADPGPLSADTATDVCVVGAGIAGMSVAYQLARQGKSVVVLNGPAISDLEPHR